MLITTGLLTAAGLAPILAVYLHRRSPAPVSAPQEIPEDLTCRAPAPDEHRRCTLDLGHYGWHGDADRSWWDGCWVEELLPSAPAPEPEPQPEPEPVVKPKARPKAKPRPAPLPEPELPLQWGSDPEPEPPAPLARIDAARLATEFSERWRNRRGPYVQCPQYPLFLAQENQNLRVRRCS